MRVRSCLAAVAVAMLAQVAPAGASCVNGFCDPTRLPGSVDIDIDAGGSLMGSCFYEKDSAPAPPGWDPENDAGGPYAFIRTKNWGNQPGYGPGGIGWDRRVCNDVNSVGGG